MKNIIVAIGLLFLFFSQSTYAEGKTINCGATDKSLPWSYDKITFDVASEDAEVENRAIYKSSETGEVLDGSKWKDNRTYEAKLQAFPTSLRFTYDDMPGVSTVRMEVSRKDLSYKKYKIRSRTGQKIGTPSSGVCELVIADTTKNIL